VDCLGDGVQVFFSIHGEDRRTTLPPKRFLLLFTNLGAPKDRRTEHKCAERSLDHISGKIPKIRSEQGFALAYNHTNAKGCRR
jgi:hypothetical protein